MLISKSDVGNCFEKRVSGKLKKTLKVYKSFTLPPPTVFLNIPIL